MDWLPWMHTAANRSKEKDSVHLIQARVLLCITLLLREQVSKSMIKKLPPYPYSQWSQRLGGKRSLLNLLNMITVFPLFLLLMALIDGWDGWIAITRCIQMKNPNIKKGTLSSPPKSPCTDISMDLILLICGCRDNCLSSKLLQRWFNSNIITNFTNPVCSKVTYLIMMYKGQATVATYHGMVRGKGRPTNTVDWGISQLLSITQL